MLKRLFGSSKVRGRGDAGWAGWAKNNFTASWLVLFAPGLDALVEAGLLLGVWACN